MSDLGALRDRLANLHRSSAAERRALRDVLLTHLAAPDSALRALSAQGLGRVGDEASVPPLLAALHDPAPLVQWQAAHALRALSHNGLVPEERLSFHDGAAFDVWKIGVLNRMAAGLDDPSLYVRLESALALAAVRAPATLPALVAALSDGEPAVEAAVRDAILAVVGDDPERIGLARTYLRPALRDGEPLLRRSAVEMLGALGDRAAVPDLLLLLHDPQPRVRASACLALGGLRDPAASEGLIGRLADDDPGVRGTAAEALGRIGDPYAVAPLLQIGDDEHPAVRRSVLLALGRLGAPAAQPALVRGLHDPEGGVRLAAIQALAATGDRQALRPLAALRRDRTAVGEQRLDREAIAAGRAITARVRHAGG